MIIRLLRSRVGADGGCWLTGGNSGDPSRTLVKTSAKVFTNKESAEKYIKKKIRYVLYTNEEFPKIKNNVITSLCRNIRKSNHNRVHTVTILQQLQVLIISLNHQIHIILPLVLLLTNKNITN